MKDKYYVKRVKGHSGIGYYIGTNKKTLGGLDSKFIGTSKKDIKEHKKFMKKYYNKLVSIRILK